MDGKTGPILIQPGNLVKANDTNPLVDHHADTAGEGVVLPAANGLPQIQEPHDGRRRLPPTLQVHNATETHENAPVDFVGNAVSATTGTIELRATFPNTDDRLVPAKWWMSPSRWISSTMRWSFRMMPSTSGRMAATSMWWKQQRKARCPSPCYMTTATPAPCRAHKGRRQGHHRRPASRRAWQARRNPGKHGGQRGADRQ